MKLRPLLPTLLGFALGLNAAEAPAGRPDVPAALRDWLGTLPGGVAAALIEADGTTAFYEAGCFSASDPRPLTADTQFEIGSLTKVFTALLLADAAQEGKLALKAPVGAPFAKSAITCEQLATHTSGLPRLPAGFTSAEPANPYREHDLDGLVKAFNLAAPRAHPSAGSDYSNFGYAVLGQAVASVWGESYATLLRRRVLAPLGMDDTVAGWREADPHRLAPGHNEGQPAANWDLTAFAPAGALVSTTRDLAKFVGLCLAKDPGSPLHAALADTLRPRVSSGSGTGKVGLAWQISPRGPATVCWHNGGTGGYGSFLAFSPDTGKGIVLLTNHTRGLEELGFSLLAGKRPPPPAPTAPELLPCLGSYPLSPAFVITITASGKDLFLQATKQPRLSLRRVQPDRYAVNGVKAEIVFERDATGTVTGLVLEQNGARQRAPRQPPPGEK